MCETFCGTLVGRALTRDGNAVLGDRSLYKMSRVDSREHNTIPKAGLVNQTGMEPNKNERDGTESIRNALPVNRRRVLHGIGAGTVFAGLGTGVAAADKHGDGLPMDVVSGKDIHPVFGFSALSSDVEPPVAPDHEVQAIIRPREDREIPEFFFEPTGIAIEPGDTVRFSLVTPHHSVTAYHPAMGTTQRVPDGVPPFSSPVLPVNAYWLYTFEEEGVYDVHCGPHEIFGHIARIVAGSATGPGAEPVAGPDDEPMMDHGEEPEEGPMLRPPVGTAVTVLNDPALRPDCILAHGTVNWDEIDPANKELEL